MTFHLSKSSLENLHGVHEDAQLILREALDVSPIDFGIPDLGGLRTAPEQFALYMAKKSFCDGYKRLSNHQLQKGRKFVLAFDVFAYVGGKASWEKHHLAMIAGVILSTQELLLAEGKIEHRFIWGGTFGSDDLSGWDMCHYEADGVRYDY